MIADSAATFPVGEISAEAQRLLDVCRAALDAGIEAAQLGAKVGDISPAVQTVVEEAGFSVVRSLVGHGVGRAYHEDPAGAELRAPPTAAPELVEGMTFAIEPMITAGGADVDVARRRLVDLDRRRRRSRPISSTPSRSPPTARGC